jgi:hypothetical protein
VAALFRDVFMRRDPAAVRHGLVVDGKRASVLEDGDCVRGFRGEHEILSPRQVLLGRHIRETAGPKTLVRDFAQRNPRLHLVTRQAVHVGIAVVADDQASFAVKEAKTLRNVVDRRVKPQVLRLLIGEQAGEQPPGLPSHEPARRHAEHRADGGDGEPGSRAGSGRGVGNGYSDHHHCCDSQAGGTDDPTQ